MYRLFTSLAATGLLLTGAQAFAQTAQDSNMSSSSNASSNSSMTASQKRQAMKDCVTKELRHAACRRATRARPAAAR